ncbi:hypothetical protein, partial [Mycobacterium sp. NS-7484]
WSIGPQTALRLADAAIAAHLKALADERVVAVELPEQMVDRSNVAESLRGEPMWETGGSWTCLTSPDCIEFEAAHQTEYGTLSVREARELAAALLAAADAAEASR